MSNDFRKDPNTYLIYLRNEYNKLNQIAEMKRFSESLCMVSLEIEQIISRLIEKKFENPENILSKLMEIETSLNQLKMSYLFNSSKLFIKNPKFLSDDKKNPDINQPIYMYHPDPINKLSAFTCIGWSNGKLNITEEILDITLEELERNYISLEQFIDEAIRNDGMCYESGGGYPGEWEYVFHAFGYQLYTSKYGGQHIGSFNYISLCLKSKESYERYEIYDPKVLRAHAECYFSNKYADTDDWYKPRYLKSIADFLLNYSTYFKNPTSNIHR